MTASLHGLAPRRGLSNSDEWQTPRRLFNAASDHYGPFSVDVAAAKWNALCARYHTKRTNGLDLVWSGRAWCNCPYSRGNLMTWVGEGRKRVTNPFTRDDTELVCMLVPAYTSEGWWHRHVLRPGRGKPGLALVDRAGIGRGWRAEYSDLSIEVVFVEGRLRFRHESGVQDSARHPSAIVVFSR